MNVEVVVVGDVMVDVVTVPEGPIAPRSDTPSRIRSQGGGSAANTACWLAWLGVPVGLVAAVGDDALGRAALAELEAAGVRFLGTVVGGRPTGTCVVLVDEAGERTMLPDRGANDALAVGAVGELAGARWLHLSGYALLGSGSRAAGRAAAEAATAANVPWSLDASSAAPLRSMGADSFLALATGCSVLFANDDEVAALGGFDAVLARGHELVAKHGVDGSSWTDGRATASACADRATLIDSVGAGDAFDAGFLHARLGGADPGQALRAGAAVAATCLSVAGGRPPSGRSGG